MDKGPDNTMNNTEDKGMVEGVDNGPDNRVDKGEDNDVLTSVRDNILTPCRGGRRARAPLSVAPSTDPDVDSETEGWLTRSEARQRIGCSYTTLARYVARGHLHPQKVDGQDRFDPDECSRLALVDHNREDSPQSEGIDHAVAEVIRASTALTNQTRDHFERMFEQHRRATEVLLGSLTEQMKLAHAQALQAEQKNIEMRAAAERAMSEDHQRKMVELEFSRRTTLQDRALEMLKVYAPAVFAYAVQKHPELAASLVQLFAKDGLSLSALTGGLPAALTRAEPTRRDHPSEGRPSEMSSKAVAVPSGESADGSSRGAPGSALAGLVGGPPGSPAPAEDQTLAIASVVCDVLASMSDDQVQRLRDSGAFEPLYMDTLVEMRNALRKPPK